jgi:polysaccharide pyruvyl transferase CsaB
LRYLISGYYGEGNAGDEAILAGILQEIDRRDAEAEFVVLSFNPDDTARRHGGGRYALEVASTSLRSPRRLRALMQNTDLLVSGGGTFLHEADFAVYGRSFLFRAGKLRPVPYFLSIVAAARAVGLPVMWYAQGLGPLHTRSARRMVAATGSLSQIVSWRDPDSAYLAYDIGVRPPVQLVVPDPAYALLPAHADEAARFLADHGMAPGRRFVAVCVRPWLGRSTFIDNVGVALEGLVAVWDLDVVLIPFHETLDPPVCDTLAARPALAGRALSLPPVPSSALLGAVLGRAEVVLAMRLHSGILAAVAGTPAVVIDYDPKTQAFAGQTRQLPWAVPVDALGGGVHTDILFSALEDTLLHLEARRAALAKAVAPLRAEAGRTAVLAVQLARTGGVFSHSDERGER